MREPGGGGAHARDTGSHPRLPYALGKREIIMRWMTAAAIVIGSGLALSTAKAADLKPPMPLSDQQLAQVTAAGTIFVGVLKGNDVVFSRTVFNVPVTQERNRQTEIGGFTIRFISTKADILIPPTPFPQ